MQRCLYMERGESKEPKKECRAFRVNTFGALEKKKTFYNVLGRKCMDIMQLNFGVYVCCFK